MDLNQLKIKSLEYRKTILDIIYKSGAGHTGGSLSCIDILNVLYNQVLDISPKNYNERDRNHYIHSKGHSVEALYTVLCDQGFFSRRDLEKLNHFDSHFIGHPTRKILGIEHNTGALGHGLSVAVGLALSKKINKKTNNVFSLLGDGELSEGSVWEACNTASKYKLDNLIVIIDRNDLQITGNTEDVNPIEPIDKKFESFGFEAILTSGNNISDLLNVFKKLPIKEGKPTVVIAKTIKGSGVSFIENQINWHHKVPSEDEYGRAISELNEKLSSYE